MKAPKLESFTWNNLPVVMELFWPDRKLKTRLKAWLINFLFSPFIRAKFEEVNK